VKLLKASLLLCIFTAKKVKKRKKLFSLFFLSSTLDT
jgi:hypothetical protein